jgi:uncharacterized membrane protein
MSRSNPDATDTSSRARPFRRAVYRGLSLVAPSLLTIALLFWIGSTIRQFVLQPVTRAVRAGLVWQMADVRRNLQDLDPATTEIETFDGLFVRVGQHDYVPLHVFETVRDDSGAGPLPSTGREMYARYVDVRYLGLPIVVPLFLVLFILVLYLLGKFLAEGIGRFVVDLVEQGMARLPVVRSLYPSIKQVTHLLINEHESGATRIVAVEFPSPGTWAIGFVTGESLPQLSDAMGESLLSVHVPYPPVLKGSVITVRKSKAIELNMTIDQAIQYVVSCGVLRPPQQIRGPGPALGQRTGGQGERRE